MKILKSMEKPIKQCGQYQILAGGFWNCSMLKRLSDLQVSSQIVPFGNKGIVLRLLRVSVVW